MLPKRKPALIAHFVQDGPTKVLVLFVASALEVLLQTSPPENSLCRKTPSNCFEKVFLLLPNESCLHVWRLRDFERSYFLRFSIFRKGGQVLHDPPLPLNFLNFRMDVLRL